MIQDEMAYLDAEDREELREEPGVHVPAHLVEDEPIADAAPLDVPLHVPHFPLRVQIAPDPKWGGRRHGTRRQSQDIIHGAYV